MPLTRSSRAPTRTDLPQVYHPRVEWRANLKSISHRCNPIMVAFVRKLTKETIDLPLGCLQGGDLRSSTTWWMPSTLNSRAPTPTDPPQVQIPLELDATLCKIIMHGCKTLINYTWLLKNTNLRSMAVKPNGYNIVDALDPEFQGADTDGPASGPFRQSNSRFFT